MSERPLCSISLDVDDLWSYMKIRGDQRWIERPSYLPRFLPVALDTLEEIGLRITFFVVGFDATVESNARVMASIVARGEHLEQRFAPAVARPAKAARALPAHCRDRVLGLGDLLHELVARVQVQPRLVLERMIAHLVPARDDRRERARVAVYRGVEADHEEGDAQPHLLERIERHGKKAWQIRGSLDPPLVAADLHVRPEIVHVERDAAQRTLRHARPRTHGSREMEQAPRPGDSRARRSRSD